eukprot:CAMPEP_0113478604 /NCGR_PEP_ID=MMETSP0014_2-20120614/20847_1 /TAXON_ID=2857 /ORGANISM="Nitzschia sp." /LENGTH=76 /DNA_ID=CAMNT_0000371811 /DNA_START=650 /DNA_END=880 /DNA_ORIENTATION=- /assembly_acc=CAM_ASM_000159
MDMAPLVCNGPYKKTDEVSHLLTILKLLPRVVRVFDESRRHDYDISIKAGLSYNRSGDGLAELAIKKNALHIPIQD